MSGDVTAVFVLPGFRMLATEVVDSEVVLSVETPRRPVGCPRCGAVARVKDRRTVTVRDLPTGGTPVIVKWRKRIFECRYALCENKTWTERNEAVAPRAVLTERARRWGFEQVGFGDRAVSAVAGELGVAWRTIMTQVSGRGKPLVDDPERLAGVRAIGVDETSFLRATGKHPTQYATGIADLSAGRTARLLDVTKCRSGTVLGQWLGARDDSWRAEIQTASLALFRGYATALTSHLPAAVRVLDPFHLVKLARLSVNQVRRRVQQDTTGHPGLAGDPLYRARLILRRRHDRPTARQAVRLQAALLAGDPNDEVTLAWAVANV